MYIYEQDLALNKLLGLIWNTSKPNQTNNIWSSCVIWFIEYVLNSFSSACDDMNTY